MNYFNEQGHLTDEGVALFSEALKFDKLSQLPEAMRAHMEQCPACHGQAIELYTIIEPMDYETPAMPKGKERMSRKYFHLMAAAAIVLLAAFFFFMKMAEESPDTSPQKDTINEEQQLLPPKGGTVPDTIETVPKQQKKRIYAANFVPATGLESLIGQMVRGEELEVLTPGLGQKFSKNDPVLFEWKGKEGLSLQLIVLNNKEENIYSAEIKGNNFLFDQHLLPGLYYWKLESPDDLVYVGKFFVPEE